MADYTTVARVGNAIADLLKDALVPELLSSPDQIGMCPPDDYGDYSIGIWLYDVREDPNIQMHEMINDGCRTQRYPSSYLSLYYMITPWLRSDLKYRAVQEHQIMGRIIQSFRDHPLLDPESFTSAAAGTDGIRFQMQNLPIEEKIRLWTVPGSAYRTSLFYTAAPVEIRSARTRMISRVREITYQFADSPQK